jgi:hypothetical protein
MANVLHWIGAAFGLLVIAVAVRFFLRGLTLKPSNPPPRVPGKVRHREK